MKANKAKIIDLMCAKDLTQEQLETLSSFAKARMLELQKELLNKFNTHFDNFYSETELHKSGKVEECVEKLKQKGMLYRKRRCSVV